MKRKKLILLITFFIFGIFFDVRALKVNSNVSGTVDPNSKLVIDTSSYELDNINDISAYKIINVFYNSTSNVITYEFTSNFKAFLASNSIYKNLTIDDYMQLTSNDTTSTITNSTLDKLLSLYTTYVKTHSISPEFSDDWMLILDAGVYLILPINTMDIYAVMTANIVPFVNANGTWALNGGYSGNAKVTSVSVSKSVSAIGTVSASYGFSDTFKYYIVGTVPSYPTNSTNRVYTITDTLGSGISIVGVSNFVIKDGATTLTTNSNGTVVNASGNKVATISISGQNITVTFDVNYVTTNNVTIMYDANINSSAVLGSLGNLNSAVLKYSNDPYGTGTVSTTAVKTTVYTYGIELLAYDKSSTSTKLSGAVFEVYSDSGLTKKIGTITTGTDGVGTLHGVAEGTYYIKNTKASTGYGITNTTSMKVKITGSVAGSTAGYYKVEMPATKAATLPFTGGIGTIIYTIIGMMTIILSVVIFRIYQNKNNDERLS